MMLTLKNFGDGGKAKLSRKGERGITLVSVLFVMMLMSSVGVGLSSTLSNKSQVSIENIHANEAFYAAEAGLQYILTSEFMPDSDYSNNVSPTAGGTPIAFENAEILVAYSNLSTYSGTVQVTANVGNSTRTVQQDVSHAVALGKPIFSGGNVAISGNQPCIFWGLICFPSGYMDGDIGAGGSITNPSHFIINGTKTPYMQVVVPGVEIDPLIPIATDTTHSGNLVIGPGTYTQDVHVTGDVSIQDGTIINGNVVADGDITMTGNVLVFGTLAAGGDVNGNLAQNSILWAQDGPNGETLPAVMAEGNISIQASGLGSAMVGLAMAGGTINFYSTISAGEAWGEAIIISGAAVATSNLTITNQKGFTLILGDDSLIASIAEAGNIKLENWKEV